MIDNTFLLQAGGMERAKNLPKLRDNESEYLLGYVFAVSGPGKYRTSHMTF